MKRQLPSLHALRAFEAAARLGRMSAAALELSVTPGAISRQVQQLELSLHVKLFEGSKNKPVLTPAAQQLLSELTPALDQMEAAVKAIRDTNCGTLDVACFSTFMVKWLIPRLFDFNVRYPDIEIRLTTTQRADDPDQQRMDLVISVQAFTSNLTNVLPLFPEQLGPVLAPSLAASLALKAPPDLAGKTLLQSKGRLNAWSMWATAMECPTPQGPGPTFDHFYFALEAAVSGLGIAVAPWHLVADDILAGRLTAPFGFRTSGLHYVAKRRPQPNPRLALFGDWLQAQAAQFVLHPHTDTAL